jgi:hypothetical protein
MKVWEQFKALGDARASLKGRNCWRACWFCSLKWDDCETEYVHMLVTDKNETRFICDVCNEKRKKNNYGKIDREAKAVL